MKNKQLITRRNAIIAGLTSLGGLVVAGCTRPGPPTYGNILRMGDAVTYHAQRALLPGQSLAKEYNFSNISSFPATGTINPADSGSRLYNEEYERVFKSGFADWGLSIEGKVSRPGVYSLADLQTFPSRTQITRHTCEEGWTAIAQWTGVNLSTILQSVGIQPSARFVNFTCFDGYYGSIDLLDAFHPQTILAYGMNGRNLPVEHGAPVRLRVEKQIGYKSLKYLKGITVTDQYVDNGDSGWAWYTGI